MKQFDHLSIFVSIIIALGVVHIITGALKMIQLRGKIKLYYPTLIWMVTLFLLQLQIWWVFFFKINMHEWQFFGFMLYLMIPIIVSVLSQLIIPDLKPNSDLEIIYFRNRKWLYGLISIVTIISVLEEYIGTLEIHFDLNLWFRIIFLIFFISGFVIRAKLFHLILTTVIFIFMIIYVALLFSKLTS